MDGIGDFAFWLAAGFLALGLTFGPIGKALARRLEPPRPPAEGDPERLGDLEHRVTDLEQSQSRVAELEERLDFAERMLAQHRDTARLGDGGG